MILVSRTSSDMALINALARTGLYARARLMKLKSEVLKNLWWDYQISHH